MACGWVEADIVLGISIPGAGSIRPLTPSIIVKKKVVSIWVTMFNYIPVGATFRFSGPS